MIFNASDRKSRTQWAKELKGTDYKTFTHPSGCKHGHDKLFSVSEDGKCVECVRLKDRKRYAKKLGISLEELEQKRVNEQHQQAQRQLEKAEGQLQRRIWHAEAKAQPTYAHVYALTCTETDRTYIGSTQNLSARMAQHLSLINSGTHHVTELLADLDAHGKETLKIDILCTIHSGDRQEVEALERFYLDTWKGELFNKYKPRSTLVS